jgi:hypothetical protein
VVDDWLVSPIFSAKPCTVQGVLDIRLYMYRRFFTFSL